MKQNKHDRRYIPIEKIDAELRALAVVYPEATNISQLIRMSCYGTGTFYSRYKSPEPMIEIVNEARAQAGIKATISLARRRHRKEIPAQPVSMSNIFAKRYPVKYGSVPTVLKWARKRSTGSIKAV